MAATALLDGHPPRHPDRPAVHHDGRVIRHGELDEQAERLAAGLSARLRPGALLAIWLPNRPELICLYLACLRAGIVAMPLHAGMAWPEVAAILRHAGADTLVSTAELVGSRIEDCLAAGIAHIHLLGDDTPAAPCLAYADLLDAPARRAHPALLAADAPALVLFTSGTAGRAKGVVLSRANLRHILDFRLRHTRLGPDSVGVMASCLTQSVGLHQTLAMLAAGGSLVLLADYDVERMAAAVLRHRPSHLIMVVEAFDRLLHHPAITPASLAATVFSAVGADRVTARVQDRHLALTGRPLNVSYGMTESSWAIVNLEGRPDKRLALGKPCPGVEVRLVGPDGEPVLAGAVGEIQIRSPRTMLGYLHEPELTRAAFVDGWLASGDLAYLDADGYYWFAGRRKHLIVLASGDNVSPLEVEQAILGHPGVAGCLVEAARPGGPDAGEEPHAQVVRLDPTLTEAALLDYLKARLSACKIPRRIRFVAALPVGPTGKLRRGCHDDGAGTETTPCA